MAGDQPVDTGLRRIRRAVVGILLVAVFCGVMVFGGPFVRNEMKGHGPSESDAGYATLIYALSVLLPVAVLVFPFFRQRPRGSHDTQLANSYVALAIVWCGLTISGVVYFAWCKDYPVAKETQPTTESRTPRPLSNDDLRKYAKIGVPSPGDKPLAVQQEEEENERKVQEESQKKRREEEARQREWSSNYPAVIGLFTSIIGVLSAFVLYVDLFLAPTEGVAAQEQANADQTQSPTPVAHDTRIKPTEKGKR